ncbi:MAG: hypothetical protein HRU12_03800, partial [Phaeodactylibacter sp.]|nr:hypothetical protein [Phaeodactylibacter sp.]
MSKEKQGASNAGATHIPREAMFRREHWPHIDDYNNIHLIDKEKLGIELPDWYGLLMKHHSGGANAIPTQILKHSKLKQSKPNEKDLELIKSIVRSDSVNVDAFGVYESIASSDEVDSDRDKFALPILAEMAKQYKEGRPIVWGHDRQGGIGRSFDAYIESTEEKNYLIVKFYVLDTAVVPTGKAKDLLDAAVYNDVSVSLAIPEGYKFVESEESADGRYFREFSNPKGLSVFHLGIVDAGANQDARLKSTFPLDDTFTGKNQPEMPEKREIKIKSL